MKTFVNDWYVRAMPLHPQVIPLEKQKKTFKGEMADATMRRYAVELGYRGHIYIRAFKGKTDFFRWIVH